MECCRQIGEKNGNDTLQTTHASYEHANLSVLPQHAMPAMFWHIGNMLNGAESTPHMLWNTASKEVRRMEMIHHKQCMHHKSMVT